jgi:tetratricopeptide (TPR) repeat protein
MTDSMPEDLKRAEELMYNAKYTDALAIIEDFEKSEIPNEADYLSGLILKGNILNRMLHVKKAVEVGELAYQLSQKLENNLRKFDSLVIKSYVLFLGKFDEGNELLIQAEKLLETITLGSQEELWERKEALYYVKSWNYCLTGDYDQAVKYSEQSLEIAKNSDKKLDVAKNTSLSGLNYAGVGNFDQGLLCIEKAAKLFKEFDDNINVAWCLLHLGNFYNVYKGELDRALDYYDRCIEIKECPLGTKMQCISNSGAIFLEKGELNRALECFKSVIPLIDELGEKILKGGALTYLGRLHMIQGDLDQAIEYFDQVVQLGEESGLVISSILALHYMIMVSIDKGFMEQAKQYMNKIDELSNVKDSKYVKMVNIFKKLCQAMILKSSTRIGKLSDAERLLRQIIEDDFTWHQVKAPALINLCDLLLSELKMTNNPEVLDDLEPLIEQLTQIAENQHSYSLLAEVDLLKGRLELIRLNLDLARQFLTRAQKIAYDHGLQLLAQKISHEHDLLLGELETWHNLKKTNASISERLKLAPVDDITDRMLGKRAVEPPDIADEQPILLLIMSRDGISYFTHPFSENWDSDWLFSSFMSAFDTFSSKLFSESIDRIKIGENIILINPVEQFLVCYVIKGQSYPALQRLNRFSDAVKWNTEIWETLNRAIKTGEVLEVDKPQSLGSVVNEIFNQ